jgi:hypothetical protein
VTTIVESSTVRPSAERGTFQNGWLDAKYSFSFNRYYDPRHVRFRSMRVLNEDRVAPGQGFGMHPHDNMEILTWVLSGALQHRDSTGGGGVIRHGDLQHMTAGTGVQHSEFNPSAAEPTHLFQIWIFPERRDLPPGYSQKSFLADGRRNRLQRIASLTGRDGAIRIHQDAEVFALDLDAGQSVTHPTAPERGVWIQVAHGSLTVNGNVLNAGDAISITGCHAIELTGAAPTHVLLFDLA